MVFPDCRDPKWIFLERRDQSLVFPDFADRGNVCATGATKRKLTATGVTEGKLVAVVDFCRSGQKVSRGSQKISRGGQKINRGGRKISRGGRKISRGGRKISLGMVEKLIAGGRKMSGIFILEVIQYKQRAILTVFFIISCFTEQFLQGVAIDILELSVIFQTMIDRERENICSINYLTFAQEDLCIKF